MNTDFSLAVKFLQLQQRALLASIMFVLVLGSLSYAHAAIDSWDVVLQEARGQTVYFHAWGGDSRVNAHIAWAAAEMARRYDVTLRQVKLADTADAVSRIMAEMAAGRDAGGAVDLLWLNGENFAALHTQELLFGPWAAQMPSWQYVDVEGYPALLQDFTLATEGYEAPWTRAQLIFYFDSARLAEPPRTISALLDWARANPGRFAYPQPPDFLGTTFLKQALYGLLADPGVLATDPDSDESFARITAPLWTYLDQLHPLLWRAGRAYPANGPRLRQMLADAEIDLALSMNPGEVAAAINDSQLPTTIQSFVPADGSIGNTSYLAIPFNASARAGALVTADFLLSPEAQARQQDPAHWGSPAVLIAAALPASGRIAAAQLLPMGRQLPEPHPVWTELLEQAWEQRYGNQRQLP